MLNLGKGTPQSPLSSASIVMLRDAPLGLEVLLLQRHGLSDVLGGAYVFPGGKLDRDDVELIGRLDQPLAVLHAALCEPRLSQAQAGALYVAAIREAFEEVGVLYAVADDRAEWGAWAPMRQRRRFVEVLDRVGAPLTTACLVPWSRWITPATSVLARKHFDTYFFVAAVPPGQEPVHDQHEATATAWLRPQQALHEYWEAKIQLPPPQIMSLAQLSRHRDVAGVFAEARSRTPMRIQPVMVDEGGVRMVCFPGDERHPIRSKEMPGPTRLYWRDGRYEPEGGLETLLG